jgi:LemA protein
MKKLIIFFAVIFSILSFQGCGYNNMVSYEEEVNQSWAQVENQYQRRSDLIPNLVKTVQGYSDHEKSVLVEVTEARSQVGQIKLTAADLNDPEKFAAFQKAQDGLSGALSRLMVVVEKYPDLKANEQYTSLMASLEGTENRISVERKKYNQVVQNYNTYIKSFPTLIFAKVFGFSEKQYFKSTTGSDKAPEINFDNKK